MRPSEFIDASTDRSSIGRHATHRMWSLTLNLNRLCSFPWQSFLHSGSVNTARLVFSFTEGLDFDTPAIKTYKCWVQNFSLERIIPPAWTRRRDVIGSREADRRCLNEHGMLILKIELGLYPVEWKCCHHYVLLTLVFRSNSNVLVITLF